VSRDGASVDDAVELIGDEVAGDDQAAPEANPRSVLTGDDRGALIGLLGADVRFDEPMRRHTTLKIGGPADALAEPSSIDALAALCRLCAARAIPLVVVGGGSNLLVKDGGIRGVVLSTRHLRGITVEGAAIRAEAGVSTGKVLSTAMKHDLGGVEFLGGVPGSIGGGLIMNAGTYLGELKDVTSEVVSVRIADGAIVRRDNPACGFRYRHSDLPATEVVAAARLTLRPRPRAEIEAEVKDLRRRRHDREPKKVASAGSIFKNPTGDFAGRLIEAAALKGTRIGDALCSPVHANWLVNVGAATAADLLALIDLVRGRVHEAHGIALEMEVKVIGDD
jgi:UDP-N-acetylmuramate dehydrogenase